MMQAFPIPVRSIGPGSQPPEDAQLDVMPMPRAMSTFEMPRVPERVPAAVMSQAADRLRHMLDALECWDPQTERHGPGVALDDLPPEVLTVLNEVLGEGEVAIRVEPDPARARGAHHIQESVFGGLWRCGELDPTGRLASYRLEAGAVPRIVAQAAGSAGGMPADPDPWPFGVMNSPALLAELRSRLLTCEPGRAAGQINLTLLPLSPGDREVLSAALPIGSVTMISRGFGNCHVSSTATLNTWRVQYFNSMSTLILDTIEVVDMPEVAMASPEDLLDSRERLRELIEWMDQAALDSPQTPAAH
jgi:hydrogenase-1 operon protein HyaF